MGAKTTDLIVHSEGAKGVQAVCAASGAYHIVTAVGEATIQMFVGAGVMLQLDNANIWTMRKLDWPNADEQGCSHSSVIENSEAMSLQGLSYQPFIAAGRVMYW